VVYLYPYVYHSNYQYGQEERFGINTSLIFFPKSLLFVSRKESYTVKSTGCASLKDENAIKTATAKRPLQGIF